MATLKYWLWLSTGKGLRPEHMDRLLEHFGTPEAAYFADPAEYGLLEGLPQAAGETLLDKDLAGAEAILADCDRLGVRILTIGDADYPDRLKNIYDPPVVLYVKGRLPAFDEELAVTVVGSRKPSEYGRRMAARIGLELAQAGALVVSGIAQGRVAAASVNIVAKNPNDWSKGMVLCIIVEFYAILSLLISFLMIMFGF